MPLYGINDHSLDAKNRLTVPSKSRAELSNTVTLTLSASGCLELWPAAEYEAIAQQSLAGLNPMTPRAKELHRLFYGNAISMELDSAGRVTLPPPFTGHARIKKDVRLIGAGKYLELWDPQTYDAKNSDLMDRAGDLLASLDNHS